MFDEELERSNVNLPAEAKQVVKERDDLSVSKACRRTGILPAAYGESAVETAVKKELAEEQWEQTEAGISSVLEYLDNIAGDGGAVSIETMRTEFEAFCDERGEVIAERVEKPVSEAVDEYKQERSQKFESLLETAEKKLQNGDHVFPSHGTIEQLAELRGVPPEDIINLLQEQNPNVPDKQFRPKGASQGWRQ